MTFSVEYEDIALHSLLDAKICHNHGKFVTSVCIQPTLFSGIFNNQVSFILTYQKRELSYILRHRKFAYVVISRHFIWKFICNLFNFHLKTILRKNNYPPNVTGSRIEPVLNNLYKPNVNVHNVPKRDFCVKLPLLGSTSFQIQNKLQKIYTDKMTSCNLKVVLMSTVTVKSFFTVKDKLPNMILS